MSDKILVVTPPDDTLINGVRILHVELNEEQEAEINSLLDLIESDDDVTNVFHNMKSI
jgi:transcriptional/translational regulatory protein YebC/TACO1